MNEALTGAGFQVTTKTSIQCMLEKPQEDVESSNYIYVITDNKNGENNGIIMETLALNPATIFDTTQYSGLDGKVKAYDSLDGNHESENFPRRMLGAGAAAYVAPAGDALYNLVEVWVPTDVDNATILVPEDARSTRLARLFFEELIKDKTVGQALVDAKVEYAKKMDMAMAGGANIMTLSEYTLYGDPAFNPYEPCNKGFV